MNIYGLPDCPTEDSDNCYWDAQTQGNGQGHSFYTIMGETTYVIPPVIDPTPIIYLGLDVVLLLVLLRLRAIAIRKNRK